jgi:hypothetical protein
MNQSYKSFIALCIFLLTVTFAQAQLTAWGYKDPIKIQEVSGTQKLNYQVLVTVNTQALISAGRMQSTGNDIRFAKDCNGSVLYEYFIESGINTTTTQIWVLIDTLAPNSTRIINMFYGNSTAPVASSFDNTFPPSTRLVVTAGSITLSGVNSYTWFEIATGATVIVGPNSPFQVTARRIKIMGTLDGNGAGFLGGASATDGSGPGFGNTSTGNFGTFGGGGASYGGTGGAGGGPNTTNYSQTGIPGVMYGTLSTDSINMGSGGGGGATPGGAGGAGITLIGDVINITGTVRANGAAGTATNLNGGGGGGSGGGIRIKGNRVTFAGTLSANGGTGGGGAYSGGGGGGGRLKIFSDAFISNTGLTMVNGGSVGSQNTSGIIPGLPGSAGTTSTGTWLSKVPVVTFVPHVAITASPSSICSGANVTITASTGFSNYNFLRNNVSVQNGSSNTYSSTTFQNGTTIKVLATYASGCIDTSNVVTITVNPNPVISVSPLNPTVCTGGSVTLNASQSTSVGTGTITNTSTTYPSPYGNWYWGARHQFLITASELAAAGLTAGPITNLAFDVSSVNGAPVHQNFEIKMGATSLTSLTSFQSGLTTVMTPVNHQPVVGWNTHTFTTPFNWNGISNIIVETCFNNTSYIYNASVRQSTTTFTSTIYYRADQNGVCGNNSLTGSLMQRPNIKFAGTMSSPPSFSWTPGGSLSNSSIANPIATPSSTTTYTVTATSLSGCTGTSTVTVTVNPLPTITSTPANPTICGNGSAIITAGGGSTYTWGPSTGLSATTGMTVTANPTVTTTYTITGTNSNGCSDTSTFTVTVDPLPTVTVSPSAPTMCANSTTTLTASGANTYAWSPSNDLSSPTGTTVTAWPSVTTTYTITGTSTGGCVSSTTVTITVDPSPTVLVTPSATTICSNTSAPLLASGANTYLWSPSGSLSSSTGAGVTASPTVTTTYTILGMNTFGCMDTATVTVTVDPIPNANAGNDVWICIGDNTTLNATGGTQYSWSPATNLSSTSVANPIANPTVTTSYTVTVTNGSCSATDVVVVSVNPAPAMPIVTQNGNVLTSSSGVTYQWYMNGSPIPGETNQSYSITQSGNYAVCITDANGCLACSAPMNVILSSVESFGAGSFNVFPNPNNGQFEMTFDLIVMDDYTIELTNSLGQLIYSEQLNNFSGSYAKQIDVREHGAGIYVMVLRNSNTHSVRRVIIH